MGRINLNQLKYFMRQFTKIIPYKYRKPFYLIGGILGLIAWFNFLLYITQSKYLIFVKDSIGSFTDYVFDNFDHRIVVAVLAFLILYTCMRYFRVPKWEDEVTADGKSESKKRSNGSIYYQVNGLISVLYTLFLVLAFLPLLI